MTISVSRRRGVGIVYKYLFPDWSESMLPFLFFILCQTFLSKSNYGKGLYLVKTRRRVPAEIWRQAEIWTLLCFLSPSSPHKSFPSGHHFCFFQRKSITYFWNWKKSNEHVTRDFPDNLKQRAWFRNCCLSFRHRRNPSYLNLCLPSESVNSKLRLIVKQACC